MYNFLTDLDEYFCETYANYDKLCVLPGYKMPMMQASRIDEFGRTRTYTLPANTMRLAAQEKKAALLAELKNRLVDITFSFTFEPIGGFRRFKNALSVGGFSKLFRAILKKYALEEEQGAEGLAIDKEIWQKIYKGKFMPTKNLLFSLALAAQISWDDTLVLFNACGYEFDYAYQKDVVLSYLIKNQVYDRGMIEAALDEYKISNLFLA